MTGLLILAALAAVGLATGLLIARVGRNRWPRA